MVRDQSDCRDVHVMQLPWQQISTVAATAPFIFNDTSLWVTIQAVININQLSKSGGQTDEHILPIQPVSGCFQARNSSRLAAYAIASSVRSPSVVDCAIARIQLSDDTSNVECHVNCDVAYVDSLTPQCHQVLFPL